MVKNKIGIIQGRLSPQKAGECRLQFFPQDFWDKEFFAARELGFSAIEWVFDWKEWSKNPYLFMQGLYMIVSAAKRSHIEISSVCADYFLKYPFWGSSAHESAKLLCELIGKAYTCGQRTILIPLLEEAGIMERDIQKELIQNIVPAVKYAAALHIHLAFETELSADEMKTVCSEMETEAHCPSFTLGVYYDIGNATSYGHDCPKEIRLLGRRIKGVHIKDRQVGSPESVPLGRGDVNFEECFRAFSDINYHGPYILQAWRGKNYLKDAKEQLEFVKKILEKEGVNGR